MLAHLEQQFPRRCSSCSIRFESLTDYVEITTPLGSPQDFDEGRRASDPGPPLGVICYANCVCGSTISVNCNIPDPVLEGIRKSIALDARDMGCNPTDLWEELHSRVLELVSHE
jgi:hypothetical protein